MNKLIYFPIIFSGMLTINVYAQEMVFECLTSNDKAVSLYQDGDDITYKFGKTNSKPDIIIKRKLQKLNIKQEIPVGSGLDSSIEFENGTYSYTINESLNRVSEDHESTAWLDVKKNGNIINSIDCNVNNGSLTDINISHK
jgi:hypothetical protein